MPNRASVDAPTLRLRRTVSALALLAVALGAVIGALVEFDLATRPPCKPGYVRLVDLEPVAAIISFALAGIALIVFWRSRRGTYLKLMAGASAVLLAGIAFVGVGAVANVVHHHGARYDYGCWTF